MSARRTVCKTDTMRHRLREVTDAVRKHGEFSRVRSAKLDKRSSLQFMAVRVPVIRRIVTKGFSFYGEDESEVLATWDYIWNHSPFFEVKSVPIDYLSLRKAELGPRVFATVRHWITSVENWAHCDGLSYIYSYACHNDPTSVLPFLKELAKGNSIWQRRASLVSLVHYVGRASMYLPVDVVLSVVEQNVDQRSPYVRKAVYWVLREAARKHSTDVASFVSIHSAVLTKPARRLALTR